MATTVHSARSRRVVRRARPAIDLAYETALSDLAPELRPLVILYAENMRAGQEIRSELSSAMTAHGLRWLDIDRMARSLT